MILKVYQASDSNPYFRSLRMAKASDHLEKKEIFSIPFGNPVFLFFLQSGCVRNFSEYKDGVIIGQHTKPLRMELNENFNVLAVHLNPYGLKQYLNINASLLTNRYADVNDFDVTKELCQVLKEDSFKEDSIPKVLEDYFNKTTKYPISSEIVRFIEECRKLNGAKVKELLKNVYLTEKSLLRKCKSEVGLTPKQQLRVGRLFTIVQNLQRENDWIQLVYDYHFTDQSHLIKEFKNFAALTPVKFIDRGLLPIQQLPETDSFTE